MDRIRHRRGGGDGGGVQVVTLTPGTFVRLIGHRAGNHAKPGRVVAVKGDKVLVRPGGHGHDEWVEARFVRYWKAKNEASR